MNDVYENAFSKTSIQNRISVTAAKYFTGGFFQIVVCSSGCNLNVITPAV